MSDNWLLRQIEASLWYWIERFDIIRCVLAERSNAESDTEMFRLSEHSGLLETNITSRFAVANAGSMNQMV